MVNYTKTLLISISCWLTINIGFSQKIDADSLYLKARDEAFSGNYNNARKMCRELLSIYPSYYDATALIGKTYAWEHKTDSARKMLLPLLDIEPDSYDVLTLLVDNAIWGQQYDEAISYADKALVYYPNDADILYKKANAFYLRGNNVEANKILAQIKVINARHEEANALSREINAASSMRLYQQASDEVHQGKYKEVRKTINQILAMYPDHFDAKLLMAYAYGWEGKRDSARIITQQLAQTNPKDYELLNLMIHLEIWDKEYKAGLAKANQALEAYPNDENFLYLKAWIQYLMQDYQDALKTLEQLLAINPDHQEGNELYQLIKQNHMYKDYVFLDNYFEYYKKPYLSRKFVQSVGLTKWEKFGTFTGKVNMGNELPYSFGDMAFQYELEAYPKLTSSNYLYLDYAVSGNSFFPKHRGAFEFFQRLPKGFEASLGIRFLYWDSMSWIYTGSVSWLYQRNYIAFRPYFTRTSGRWVDSYTLTYRYYFSEREDYLYTVLGFGSYSDDFLQLNPNPDKSYTAQVGILKFIHPRWNLGASVGYCYDDGYRSRLQCSAGIRYYFNMFH